MPPSHHLAIDLGAESGRVMLGRLADGRLTLTEAHRFPTLSARLHPAGASGTHYWDVLRLWLEIQTGLAQAVKQAAGPVAGIGIDTWGVDFALIAPDGSLLANPVCYRDPRTAGMPAQVFAKMPQAQIYHTVGIQTIEFNTLFQLAALVQAQSPALQAAQHLLFMPDLIGYWLTGRPYNEYTEASTSQMLDAQARTWWPDILAAIGVSKSLFPQMIYPARPDSVVGPVLPAVGDSLGAAGIPVLAVGSHDTASAVVGVPATGAADWLFLSSGTWSLLGAEVDQPVLGDKARQYDLTNEGGVGGKIRLLKNIAGLWLLQECRRAWARAGHDYDYAALAKLAEAAPAHRAVLDTNHAPFQQPGDMPAKITAYCKQTQQSAPTTPGEFTRVILESLAVRYAQVRQMLEEVTGRHFTRLHIVGGGSQNNLLNQMAADATGMTVFAGPVEATALGNIVTQAISTGAIRDLPAARELIARSTDLREFRPRDTEKWKL